MLISIGVITHFDKSLSILISQILAQSIGQHTLEEVYVITSGLIENERTEIERISEKSRILRIIETPQRLGKAHSVNIFLSKASGDICVLVSGDVLIGKNTFEELLVQFEDKDIGCIGTHIIPKNEEIGFIGYAVNLIWRIHHNLSFENPKMGEVIAFRNVIKRISEKTAVDEAWIESEIIKKGFKSSYSPNAIVYNAGPKTIEEYIMQRRRIHAGHLWLKKERGYVVASMIYPKVLKAIFKSEHRVGKITYLAAVVALEVFIRVMSNIDVFILRKNPYCWPIIDSKLLI
jgi:poly-beta-1,6-N-acetyl-D-glucosamine synthase